MGIGATGFTVTSDGLAVNKVDQIAIGLLPTSCTPDPPPA